MDYPSAADSKATKIIQHNNEYRYLKTMIEIQRVLAAAQVEGPLVHVLYSAAAFTGMRAGELAGLTWSCVDFERRLITVRCSYDGPTKNGEIRYVPILDALLPTLRAWRLQCPGLLVFPTSKGTMRQASDRSFSRGAASGAQAPALRLQSWAVNCAGT